MISPLQHITPTMPPVTILLLLSSTCITLSLQHLMTSLVSQCRISEYQCRNGRCVSLDRFCNEYDDCGDKSDEPRYCSPCNRTYYGDVGTSYEIEVRRPREDRLPFLCFLNFTAAGAQYGDLIQLTFDTFTVGKFTSYTSDGCPDGHMGIQEEGRPPTGQWCGSAWGYTVYYSETRSINLTLNLLRLSEQGIGYNFDFKISYKFLNRFESHLRYGNTSLAIFRGDLLKNTYCDRLFYNCDKLKCRIQSPNYPGVYPRNVTCYYKVEHAVSMPNKQVLITVTQPKGHKINIKHQHIHDKTQRMLKVWDQCYVVQDYLTVYDGGTTLDPVLVRLCGGDVVPDITTSGSQMLLEFHSSAYDNPFHPVPLSYLPGFELQVEISYVDLKSNSYVKKTPSSGGSGKHGCNFHLTSFDTGWGMLSNPKHSLPPNTSCLYHFQGRAEERVWLSFVKYYAGESAQGAGLTSMATSAGEALGVGAQGLANMASSVSGGECNTRLRIYDGRVGGVTGKNTQAVQGNASILGDFCNKDDGIPKLCDHTLLSNRTRFTRPCNLHESYVSSSNEMTLELNMKLGSILYPLNFLLRYEFVSQDSTNEKTDDCFKRFNSKTSPLKGKLESTRSVFYFGRGGNENLTCVYQFDTNGTERVRLAVHKTRFDSRKCRTVNSNCVYENRNQLSELSIYEIPYDNFKIKRQCICESLNSTITVTSYMNSSLLLNFTVIRMNITQDYNHFSFDGEYEFLQEPLDRLEFNKSENIIKGKSGKINFSDTRKSAQAYNFPYLISPEDNNNYLYLKINGFLIINHLFSSCNQKYLIYIYTYFNYNKDPIVICPMNYQTGGTNSKTGNGNGKDLYFSPIEIFSYGWNNDINRSNLDLNVFNPLINSFILEFVSVNSSLSRLDGTAYYPVKGFDYMVEWIQVSKILAMNSYALTSSTMDCLYRCPEINACISAELWCDRKRHCPSGYDEDDANCSSLLSLGGAPLLYLGIGAGALLALSCLIILTVCVKFRRGGKQSAHAQTSKQTVQISAANHYHNGNSLKFLPPTDDYYMDVGAVKDNGIC
uniref:CUB domain-containing protein n=1 Tax=Cacopsylla melanoneura TaxID=428564 RepID=A0A8D8QS39_9HEMI